MTMKYFKNYINGAFNEHFAKYGEKYNPANRNLIGLYPISDRDTVNASISAAKSAFESWRSLSHIRRGDYLRSVLEVMLQNKSQLVDAIALDCGKSLRASEEEFNGSVKLARYFAESSNDILGNVYPSNDPNKTIISCRDPHGVVALIVPANTPLANLTWKVFPALVFGNTVVLKASEDAPTVAEQFVKCFVGSEIPSGAFNLINGDASTGNMLVSSPDISLISFTGSSSVGQIIAQQAAVHLTRISLELGGKNPFIVLSDADLMRAADWFVRSAFSNAGQRCSAASKLLVQDSIYTEFIDLVVTRTEALKLGTDNDADVGPLISERQLKKVSRMVDEALERGAKVLTKESGSAAPSSGYYYRPTLLSDVETDTELWNEEVFGPVVAVKKFETDAEAIQIANNSKYGLTAAVHTTSLTRQLQYSKQLCSGVVNVNLGTYGSEPHMSFGGFKHSGNGTREPGDSAINVYTELKYISVGI